ncbi:RHS repeat domain-containing protein [Sessilibacter sp. MAH4]
MGRRQKHSKSIDSNGNVLQYEYSDRGQLIQEAKPDGSEFSYDDNGNITLAIDHTGGVTRFAYNENNQLTRYTDVSGRTTEYHSIRRRWILSRAHRRRPQQQPSSQAQHHPI